MGSVGILNVGAGDIKISFDKSNPAEVIRSSRIVKDMLRRGYALLVEVDRDGTKAFERARDFDENTSEYIVADFDQDLAREKDEAEAPGPSLKEREMHGPSEVEAPSGGTRKTHRKQSRVDASSTRAIAVGRSAGG